MKAYGILANWTATQLHGYQKYPLEKDSVLPKYLFLAFADKLKNILVPLQKIGKHVLFEVAKCNRDRFRMWEYAELAS